jgi:hypothetical protein
MALYQLSGAWPVRDRLIPASTIIDTAGTDDWSRLARGLVPPLNAVPLTQDCWDAMRQHYGEQARWIVTGPGIRR